MVKYLNTTDYIEQLLLSLSADCKHISAVQSQKAVAAYSSSKQLLPFSFAEQNSSSK